MRDPSRPGKLGGVAEKEANLGSVFEKLGQELCKEGRLRMVSSEETV